MKGETPVNSTMSIGQARKMVEQLKIEASLCRIKVGGTLALISWPGLAVQFPNLVRLDSLRSGEESGALLGQLTPGFCGDEGEDSLKEPESW